MAPTTRRARWVLPLIVDNDCCAGEPRADGGDWALHVVVP